MKKAKTTTKNLRIKIYFATMLFTADGKEVFNFLHTLEREKSVYIANAIDFYMKDKTDKNISKIQDIIDSIEYLTNAYQIKDLPTLVKLLEEKVEKPVTIAPVKRTMFSLQFNKKEPKGVYAYNILKELHDSNQRAGLITEAVKFYQITNNDIDARINRAEMLLYEVSLYYKKANAHMKKNIEQWVVPYFVSPK